MVLGAVLLLATAETPTHSTETSCADLLPTSLREEKIESVLVPPPFDSWMPGIADRPDAALEYRLPGYSVPGPCWNELAGWISCERPETIGCLEFKCNVNRVHTWMIDLPCVPEDGWRRGDLSDRIDNPPWSYP